MRAEEGLKETNRAAEEQAAERETHRLLRKLMQDAVPPVPRKLNRVGELFGLYLEIAAKNGWPMAQRKERLTLLRLVILQLLAPDIFRFGRYNPTFLQKLESWKPAGRRANLNQIYEQTRNKIKELEAKPDDVQSARDLYTLRRLDQPLLTKVREAQRDRSHFDPMDLIDSENLSDSKLRRYFNLEDPQFASRQAGVTFTATADSQFTAQTGQEPIFAAKSGAEPEIAMAAPAETATPAARRPEIKIQREGYPLPDERSPAAPSDPESFFNQLFSTDEIAWRNALEQEAENLSGHRLDDSSFRMLINEVSQTPSFVQIDWLEQLEPYLTADQIYEIYQQSGLLQRLNNEIKEERYGSEQP